MLVTVICVLCVAAVFEDEAYRICPLEDKNDFSFHSASLAAFGGTKSGIHSLCNFNFITFRR
jgi:hypothetical protein